MTSAWEVLSIAEMEIGTLEDPADSNCQKYSHGLLRPCEQWCADFVAWIALQSGLVLPSDSAYTPTMANGFRSQGAWYTSQPLPGDVVFYDFPDKTTGIQHVGYVKFIDGTTVWSIEGNTSSNHLGSQDQGGGVFLRSRPFAYVVGYGRPAYTEESESMIGKDEGDDRRGWVHEKCCQEWGREPTVQELNIMTYYLGTNGRDAAFGAIRDHQNAQDFRKQRGW